MAITVARVHLAMAHAALPGLLPTPPKCTMLPLLPAPACAILLPNSSTPPRPSRADAAGRWDAHKIKPASTTAAASASASSSSSGGKHSLDINRKIVTPSRTSSDRNSNSRADSEERWDAHKRPASPASSSSSSTASSNKAKTCHIRRHPNGQRASSSADRWDAHKKQPRAAAPAPADELDDGESSTGSNDVELDMPRPPPSPRSFYAGPGFITSPEPCMLPMPSFCRIRVA